MSWDCRLNNAVFGAEVGAPSKRTGAPWKKKFPAWSTGLWTVVLVFAGGIAGGRWGGCPHGQLSAQDSRYRTNTPATATEDKLDNYLARLGLLSLRIVHLEERLRDAGAEQRIVLAQQLADLYAQQLLTVMADSRKYVELTARIQSLLQSVPQARTPTVELLLLQLDYQRAETLIMGWFTHSQAADAADQALAILAGIAPQLERYHGQFRQQVEKLMERLDASTTDVAQHAEVQQRYGLATRAGYFAAWSFFYQGALSNSGAEQVRRSRQLFRELLDIADGQSYDDIDAEVLAMESVWRARGAIGLAMCEGYLGNLPAANRCVQWVLSGGPQELRQQGDYWWVQVLLWARRWEELLSFAKDRIARLSAEPSAGGVLFCTALVHAAHFRGTPPPAAVSAQLMQLGCIGLAHMRQFRALDELARLYTLSIPSANTFALAWWRAQQLRAHAEALRDQVAYRKAAEAYEQALSLPDARHDPRAAALCRYEWAWCLYQSGQWSASQRQYMLAAEALRLADHPEAARAAWMAIVAAQKIAAPHAPTQHDIEPAVDWLRREFPQHELTKRAEFILARTQWDKTSPQEKIASLRAIEPTNPNYLPAAVELCHELFGQWKNAPPEQKKTWAAELRTKAAELLAHAAKDLSADQRVKIHLFLVQVAISQRQWQEAAQQLSAAESCLTQAESTIQSEWYYQAMSLARSQGRLDELVQRCRWFLEHGQGTPYETAALTTAANALEASTTPAQQQTLYVVYQRLAALWQVDVRRLTTDRNAHAVTAKAARLAWQLGYENEARQWYDLLLRAFPRERSYLRAMGLLTFQQKNWHRSLECWRTIIAGTAVGTDPWYEAKYYQLQCLLEIDRGTAVAVWKELQILDPQGGSPEWRDKLRQIGERLDR